MELTRSAAAFDLRTFTKAFVASLVVRDMYEVRPDDIHTRRGFDRVVRVLDEAKTALKAKGADRDFVRRVGRLANELRASNTGAFDGFETALRQVQLTFTSSPNPDYDDIVFSVSKSYAEAALADLTTDQHQIVDDAVKVFVQQIG
jgi:hypothetical protein